MNKEIKLSDLSLDKVNLHNGLILGLPIEVKDDSVDSSIQLEDKDKEAKFKEVYLKVVKIDESRLTDELKVNVKVGDIVTLIPSSNYGMSIYGEDTYIRFKQFNIQESWSNL